MQTETRGAKFIRGLVKTVFIGCYIAFMWASIHHIATFFNNFEENSGNLIGSYALAGAFDITALVTTIGVMFFRKSMPAWVFWIVWAFIVAIAGYSFFINWEYASHYENMTLIMQPTGKTVPVYDTYGTLHYIPVMRVNTGLLWVNPILASGFTIFSLIYSVVAEFFGTKAPTIEELRAKETYLKETAGVLESIKQLEGKSKGPSLIQRAKATVKEAKSAVKEVLAGDSNDEGEAIEGSLSNEAREGVIPEQDHESEQSESEETRQNAPGKIKSETQSETALKLHSKVSRNGATSHVYVSIEEAVKLLGYDLQYVKSLRTKGVLRSPRKNSNLISEASINAFLSKRQNGTKRQSEGQSEDRGIQRDTPMINQSNEASEGQSAENEGIQ